MNVQDGLLVRIGPYRRVTVSTSCIRNRTLQNLHLVLFCFNTIIILSYIPCPHSTSYYINDNLLLVVSLSREHQTVIWSTWCIVLQAFMIYKILHIIQTRDKENVQNPENIREVNVTNCLTWNYLKHKAVSNTFLVSAIAWYRGSESMDWCYPRL